MQIQFLADRPEWIPVLAKWTYAEWGHFDKNNSLEKTEERLRSRLNHDQIPFTLVASAENSPVGCVSIKADGMTVRRGLTPWLGSMFVQPAQRRQGVGTALVTKSLEICKELNIPDLYLWTEKAETFYFRVGFHTVEELVYLDQNAKIMKITLHG